MVIKEYNINPHTNNNLITPIKGAINLLHVTLVFQEPNNTLLVYIGSKIIFVHDISLKQFVKDIQTACGALPAQQPSLSGTGYGGYQLDLD